MRRIWNGSARLRPQPIGTFRQPVSTATFAARLPGTFILCKRFGFATTADRCRGNGWPVLKIDCGHDAMIINPQGLADLLLSANCQ